MFKCFVIQPFDSGKFDKRYRDIFKPALIDAGLNPYRVDEDPRVRIPITAIEEGIVCSDICFADITTNNPNVWYELGYAFAAGKDVILVCSKERESGFPFDIQHRKIIEYISESASDFNKLKNEITNTAKALMQHPTSPRTIADKQQYSYDDLSIEEKLLTSIIVGETGVTGSVSHPFSLQNIARNSGMGSFDFGIAFRKLIGKKIIELIDSYDESDDHHFRGVQLTVNGWDWVKENDSSFPSNRKNLMLTDFYNDEDIPF
ncbi:MAG: hypothetical protein F4008_11165 [Gammaproteobacteria bacterium]|nr:hypothetical protein [Gammaproteobacteria bacterium]MYL14302.1 hypothetical protein [Gammaproteobacteria bacterium]